MRGTVECSHHFCHGYFLNGNNAIATKKVALIGIPDYSYGNLLICRSFAPRTKHGSLCLG